MQDKDGGSVNQTRNLYCVCVCVFLCMSVCNGWRERVEKRESILPLASVRSNHFALKSAAESGEPNEGICQDV